MPHDPYKALYLHLPFCVKKCAYCDFTSYETPQDDPCIAAYVENLVAQIRAKSREGELAHIETVYLGGGTPSYIGSKHLTSLLYALSHSMRLEPDVECTMEANPDSVDERLIADVWALGVNRLSLGVQSFDDAVLATLGRAHTAEKARAAIRMAQTRFDNVSIDLMCGIPGQSAQMLEESLEQAIELGVSHVSVYPLSIEPGTLFQRLIDEGALDEPDDDVEAEHMALAQRILTAAGYERYEVASYARPGYACKHNIAYWTGVPYLGLGTSAATMTQNSERRMRIQDGIISDDLNAAQMRAEDLMMGMRMTCGVSEQAVLDALPLIPLVQETFASLCDEGLATYEDGRYKPTQLGWLCGNELYGRIFDLA